MQKAPREMRLLVNMLMLVMNVIMVMVKVMKVKGFVVEALLLFSLSSTPTPTTNLRTRPAARVCAWDAKGLVSSLCPLHPVDVVLEPFPETRPLP